VSRSIAKQDYACEWFQCSSINTRVTPWGTITPRPKIDKEALS
jgi:hypothetical protein